MLYCSDIFIVVHRDVYFVLYACCIIFIVCILINFCLFTPNYRSHLCDQRHLCLFCVFVDVVLNYAVWVMAVQGLIII